MGRIKLRTWFQSKPTSEEISDTDRNTVYWRPNTAGAIIAS